MARLDFVIYGATGFTGKHAVAEMVNFVKKYPGLTWSVAGRSQKKLEDTLLEASHITGEDLSQTKMIVADVSDQEALKAMCKQAWVVVNCCGPYRLYGEPVVKAAIDAKCHYVDVTGEPQFIETMQLVYDKQARDAGVYVISACGLDSIPNDMGVVFLEQNFGGTLNSVESYLSSHLPQEYRAASAQTGLLNYGTWQSLVLGLQHHSELKDLRKKLYPERLPTFHPKLQPRAVIHRVGGRYAVPFPGADNSIVYRSQRHLYETERKRPVQFRAYVSPGRSFLSAALTVLAALVLYAMSKFHATRAFLLARPELVTMGRVTRRGPSEEVIRNTHYKFVLRGRGWSQGAALEGKPDRTVVAQVSGVNPGYGATVVALLYSALTVLRQQNMMPPGGGVLTTAAAFSKTDLIKHLNAYGDAMKFEIIEQE